MQLAYVLLIICSLHMCIVHTFCTKAWHIKVCNLYENCLYSTCLCFVYAFIARVHSAHILHTKHGIFTPHAQRERGKVIGRGVHIYIYISVVEKKI